MVAVGVSADPPRGGFFNAAGAGEFSGGRRDGHMNARAKIASSSLAPSEGVAREHAFAKYHSIVFERPEDDFEEMGSSAPAYFGDLNCDQMVDAIIADWAEYDLARFFYAPLKRVDAIFYRHEVMKELENSAIRRTVTDFSGAMRAMRECFARSEKFHYAEQKQAWFLDGAKTYCDAVKTLAAGLQDLNPVSRGLRGFCNYLTQYVRSADFIELFTRAQKLKSELAAVVYSLRIKGTSFTVAPYHDEEDYSAEVETSFAKFAQGASKDYRVKFGVTEDMNHIEAKIAELVANLYPELFANLMRFCADNADLVDRTVADFDRQIHFYVAYLEYTAPLRTAGLSFCYPRVSDQSKQVNATECFDLALARKLTAEHKPVVCNDFWTTDRERVLLVSGPNQGGKTTFARMFGQVHYLASLGCPVPAREGSLFLFDEMFSHFEKEERVENLRGKLEGDLLRARDVLGRATARSIIIFNEIFTSTTIQDELFLSEKVMQRIVELDCLCVWVTFADELASFGPTVVSVVSTVDPEEPAIRTFKLVRRSADGLAYAEAIAKKYGLTYEAIRERIRQ
jgi:DNA mismatch repair protein MutS